jgi:hypothetical protein
MLVQNATDLNLNILNFEDKEFTLKLNIWPGKIKITS